MDMLSVDLSDLLAAGLGSRVELWGKQVLASGAMPNHSSPALNSEYYAS
jgi:alanine racemase